MFYIDLGARPPGRVVHPQHLLCDFPALSADPLARALVARPRFVLLADTRIGMVCEKKQRLTELRAILDSDYELSGRSSGSWDHYAVYKLKPKIPARTDGDRGWGGLRRPAVRLSEP